ncbi:MAG: MTH1187 family thiamine-binding protein [Desulfobulbaceae bacterium]|nr:MTH1187 family thiamine-binding protein [Desulfobulbaceae bacterium]
MALMQLTVIPIGTATPSVGDHVAAIHEVLATAGFPYELHDMGTLIEGEVGPLLALAARLHALSFDRGVQRVVTQIVVDERRDKKISMGDKTASVRRRLA